MFERLADEVSLLLINYKIISNEERESYVYGLELLFPKVALYLTISIIAVLSKTLLISTLFIIMYMGLRRYTGGFHCKTAEMCFLISLLIYLMMVLLYFFKKAEVNYTMMGLSVISSIIILIFSPIESSNKPLDHLEKRRYRIISIAETILITLITVFSFLFHLDVLFYSASWSLTADAVLILLTLRRDKYEGNDSESNRDDG